MYYNYKMSKKLGKVQRSREYAKAFNENRDKIVSFRMPESMYKQLKEESERNGTKNVSAVILGIIKTHFER